MNDIIENSKKVNVLDGLSRAMKSKHAELCEVISRAMDEEPYEHQGDRWAPPLSQEGWCRVSGLALRSFQALIKVPPIRRYRCLIDGKTVTLLRVGDAGAEQRQQLAKEMKGYYLRKTGEKIISAREFGMLCGLATDLPDGWQVNVFKHVLRCWPDFMDDVRAEVALALELGSDDPFHGDIRDDPRYTTARRFAGHRDRLDERIYRRPFIPLIRAFWPVAVELFIDARQFRGGAAPDRIWQRWSASTHPCAEPTS